MIMVNKPQIKKITKMNQKISNFLPKTTKVKTKTIMVCFGQFDHKFFCCSNKMLVNFSNQNIVDFGNQIFLYTVGLVSCGKGKSIFL